jgi:GPH family glycoside/pentoside/hexuronide:cation symporter
MTDNDIQQKDHSLVEEAELLPRSTKIFYSSGAVTEVLMGNLIGALAMPIYHLGLGVSASLIGIALFIPRLWDAFADPIIANISDNAHTRFGRRKPFILIGTIFTAVFTAMLWWPPAGFSKNGLFIYFLVISFLYYTAYTVFTIPYHALGPELTGDYNERIRLMSYKSFLMGLGGTLFLPWAYKLCFVFGGPDDGNSRPEVQGAKFVGLLFGLLMIIFVISPVCFTKERFATANRETISLLRAIKCTFKNKPFVIVCILIVFTIIGVYLVSPLGLFLNLALVFHGDEKKVATIVGWYGTVYGFVSMAAVPAISFFSTRFGRKRTLIAGLVLTQIGALLSWFLFTPKMPYLQLLHAVIVAPGMSSLWLLTAVFIADVCDYDELTTSLRREAMYTAVFGWFMKATVAGVAGLTGFLITWTGFDREIAIQADITTLKLRLTFMLVPVAFLILSIYLVSIYPLDREKMDQIQAQLKQNRKNRNT